MYANFTSDQQADVRATSLQHIIPGMKKRKEKEKKRNIFVLKWSSG